MHWLSMLGIALVAVGTALTLFGSHLRARRDSIETTEIVSGHIDQALTEIQALQSSASDAEPDERIEQIESEFRVWARDLLESRSSRKLEFEQAQLSSKQTELEISGTLRPFVLAVQSTVVGLVEAFNAEAGTTVSVETQRPPENLYDEATQWHTRVEFNDSTYWHITTSASQPADPSRVPNATLYVSTMKEKISSRGTFIVLLPRPDEGEILLVVSGNVAPPDDRLTSLPWPDYQDSLVALLSYLFEAQIHRAGL